MEKKLKMGSETQKDAEAMVAEMETVSSLLRKREYKEARALMKSLIKLFPNLENGLNVFMVCETLYYSDMHFPICGIDWYSVLHLHPSATFAEVNTHCSHLIRYVAPLTLLAAVNALSVITQARILLADQALRDEYDGKRAESGLIDVSTCSNTNSGNDPSFEDLYLNWKPPRFSSDVSDYVYSHRRPSSSLFPVKPTLFDEMPQRPHYRSLELDKYGDKVREGIMIGVDIALINLSEEILNLRVESLEGFSSMFDGFTKQLAQLEEMGYNVDKLRNHLDTLKGTAGHLGAMKKEQVEDQMDTAGNLAAQVVMSEDEIPCKDRVSVKKKVEACAACKYLRRKCNENCVFALVFPSNKEKEFLSVQKVFGVSNICKRLKCLSNSEDRLQAADSFLWEAECREQEPVLGCYGIYTRLLDENEGLKRLLENVTEGFDSVVMSSISEMPCKCKRKLKVLARNKGAAPKPCGACRKIRRKCDQNCEFEPFFPSTMDKEFESVHKLFGTGNVSKHLKSLSSYEERQQAAESLIWEAECREQEPVLGCYGVYLLLLHENQELKRLLEDEVERQPQKKVKETIIDGNGGFYTDDNEIFYYDSTTAHVQVRGQETKSEATEAKPIRQYKPDSVDC